MSPSLLQPSARSKDSSSADRSARRIPSGEGATWLSTRERGTVWGIAAAYWLVVLLGRGFSKALVAVISLWYLARAGSNRRASSEWLTVQLGRKPRWTEVYCHFRHFAQVTVDRVFFLKGKHDVFRIERTGDETMQAATKNRTGVILVSAHLGSFEAMRSDGHAADMPINIVGFFENARMINGLFEKLSPEAATRVIHIGKGGVDFVYAVQEAIERGEMVGIMGDRVGLSDRSVTVDFFGRPARFATGPFTLAAILGCPVYMTFGLYVEPNVYKLYCEPLMPPKKIPRRSREQEVEAFVRQYAERVEHYARLAPYNWFNFYDFWGTDSSSPPN